MPDPGWYDDPEDDTKLRWWDGGRWTAERRPRVTAAPPPPPVGRPHGDPFGSPSGAAPSGAVPMPSGAATWGSGGPVVGGPVGTSAPTSAGTAPPRSFIEAIKVCMTKSFDAKGRASRSELWFFALFTGIIAVVLSVVLSAAFVYIDETAVDFATFERMMIWWFGLSLISGLIFLAFVPASITVFIRRLHDVGVSGWFYLLTLIPWAGWVIFIVFGTLPPTPGPNRYG